jgi:uncharacterized membrane protein
MSTPKTVANVFLGVLLFLCLLALGPGIAVQATILNTGFVERNLNSLNIDAVIEEVVLPEVAKFPGFARYGFLPGSIESALLKHKDEIKQAALEVIADAHRYVARGGEFDLAAAVRARLLDPKLGAAVLADVDLTSVAREIIRQMVPSVLSSYNITPYLDSAVAPLEIWLKARMTEMLPEVYDYLFSDGPSPGFVRIPLGEAMDGIRLALRNAFLGSPPPEARNIPQPLLGGVFDTGWEALKRFLPVAMEIDLTSNIGAPVGVTAALDDINDALHQARPWVQAFQNSFWVLVVLTLVLVIVILVVNMSLVISSLVAGPALALAGLFNLGGGLFAQSAVRGAVAQSADVPAALEPWLLNLASWLFQPLIVFAAVCLIAGVAMLVVGLILRRRGYAAVGV